MYSVLYFNLWGMVDCLGGLARAGLQPIGPIAANRAPRPRRPRAQGGPALRLRKLMLSIEAACAPPAQARVQRKSKLTARFSTPLIIIIRSVIVTGTVIVFQ